MNLVIKKYHYQIIIAKTNYGNARTGGFALIMPWLKKIVSMLLPHNFHKKKASLIGKF